VSPSRSAERQLDDFAQSLIGTAHGDVAVRTASAAFEHRADVGDTIIRIRLGLSDPPAGRLTWPVDGLHDLERDIRGRAYDAGFDEFVYVNFLKASGAEDEDSAAEPGGDRRPLNDERPDLR